MAKTFSAPPFHRDKTSRAPPPSRFVAPPLPVISDQSLRMHLNTHTGETPYECPHCDEAFGNKQIQKRHINKTHMMDTLPHQCIACKDRLRFKSELKIHSVKHTDEKSHGCPQCDKCFKTIHQLNHHVLRHKGDKTFICNLCSKQFLCSSDLHNHMKSHSSERPHVCSQCGKAYKSASQLKIHIQRHTGYKPYKCDKCDMGFLVKNESISLSSSKSYRRAEIGYVMKVNFIRK